MVIRVIVPVLLLSILLIVAMRWYRASIASIGPGDAPPPSARRLTSDRLATLATPPWRVVYEIAADRLGGIDHVVLGPAGAVAIRTELGDRPPAMPISEHPTDVANAAIARGPVDDLLRPVGGRCDRGATVYWGSPRSDDPPAHEVAPGAWAVEGQRLVEWLHALPPDPTASVDVDGWWRAVTIGVGRPDPFA